MIIFLEELLAAIRKYYRVSLIASLAIGMLTIGVIVFAPRKYQSRSKVLIRLGREQIVPEATAAHSTMLMQLHRTSEHEMNTAVAEMSSRAILEKVVDDVGPELILTGASGDDSGESASLLSALIGGVLSLVPKLDPIGAREQAIVQLEEDVDIEAPDDSSVVSIKYVAKSPALAQKVVASWVDHYIDSHVQTSKNSQSHLFLLQQSEELEARLSGERERLQQAKDRSSLVTVEGQQTLLESRLRYAADRIASIQGDLFAAQERVEKYKGILESLEGDVVMSQTSGLTDVAYDGISQKIFDLESEQKKLASSMTAGHPRRTIIENQLVELKNILNQLETDRKTTVRAKNPTFLELEKNLLIDEAEVAALQQKLEQAELDHQKLLADVTKLNSVEGEIAELSRSVALLETLCSEQAKRVEQSRFEVAIQENQISSISLIQPASFEQKPVSPRKLLCVLLGGMAAVFAGLGLPFFLYDRDRLAQEKSELDDEDTLTMRARAWSREWDDSHPDHDRESVVNY